MASVLKLRESFDDSAQATGGDVVVLFAVKTPLEEVRARQIDAQKAMLAENIAQGKVITLDLHVPFTPPIQQQQPVRTINSTLAEQIAMQGRKGFAFTI